jgi:hypothetical protein
MFCMNRIILSLALLFSGAVFNLSAQGTAFFYQGHLNDSGGAANGSYNFVFSLYDAPTNGNLISVPQTNFAVAVSSGLFATNIDFGAVFTGTNYWLGIDVCTNSGTNAFSLLWPRQPLLPVPYAIFANTASNLSGTLAAAQLSGTLSSTQLSGTYSGVVNFTNAANNLSGVFAGDGAALVNLNGSQVASGTVADARLSANVAFLNGNQTFTGSNLFTSANSFTNRANNFTGSFFGNGLVGWINVSSNSVQATPDAGYLLLSSNLTTVTLPPTNSLLTNDIVRISGAGAGGWQIAQNINQSIFGSFSTYNMSAWLPSSVSSAAWINMASSADGSLMAAVINASSSVYLSTDYGHTWSASAATALVYRSVACSADGSHLIAGAAASGALYYSTNYGANWSGSTPSANWYGIAMSANGSNAVAVSFGGGIYTSTNYGANWRVSSSTAEYWESVASSANGSNLVAVATNNIIYVSANAGSSWTSPAITGGHYWAGVACSADGTKMVAVAYNGGIYTSGNSGLNWQATSAPTNSWESVTCSSDGGKITAVVYGGGIYSSVNYGANWTKQPASTQNWLTICGSADGSRLAAGVYNGRIYYSSLSQTTLNSTTSGVNGFLTGPQGSAVELQYIGNGKFMPVSSSGTIWAN